MFCENFKRKKPGQLTTKKNKEEVFKKRETQIFKKDKI